MRFEFAHLVHVALYSTIRLMQKILIILMLSFTLASCSGTRNLTTSSTPVKEVELLATDSLKLTIKAINLSEDMSRLSTKNDEILILLYELKDSLELDQFLFSKQLKLDEKNRSKIVWFSTNKELSKSRLILFLIEQDSGTPMEQIDPVIRVHYRPIINAYKSGDYLEIEKYLGDEDVLGIKTICELNTETPVQFSFNGIHKLDKYEYSISIE